MPKKTFLLDESLAVTIYKRKTSRNLRLTIAPTGEVRVSVPAWAPYRTGLDFARSRQEWIKSQSRQKQPLANGQAIGKAHRLEFVSSAGAIKPSSRVAASQVRVYLPAGMASSDEMAQKAAERGCINALRGQADSLLPQRLATLASKHGYTYKSVSVKKLKGRWGSCDQAGNITLNLFLMQLPWDLIDYVLLHELTHTKIMRHGPPFWDAMSAKLPNVAEHRRLIRSHSPVLAAAG